MKKLFFTTLFSVCALTLHAQETSPTKITVPVLDKSKFDLNPFAQLQKTIDATKTTANPYGAAGVLATADQGGMPYARLMNIDCISKDGVVFFTNQESGKWKHLAANQKASFVFYSPTTSSSVVINGVVDLNYNDPKEKDVDVILNDKKISFKWAGFMLKPTEFVFRELTTQEGYNVEQSYAYKKSEGGNWVLSETVKYYVSPKA